jgi:hypothetical protein
MMGINTAIIQSNGTPTLEVELSEYLEILRELSGSDCHEQSPVYHTYLGLRQDLIELCQNMRGIIIQEDMKQIILSKYTHNDRQAIIDSPAYCLLHDSFREILKNSIDAIIEDNVKNPHTQKTTARLTFDITLSDNDVIITFLDSGTGFPNQFLSKVADETNQLSYLTTSRRGDSNKTKDKIIGQLGGMGQGIRHLICQILTGKEFSSKIVPVRSPDFTSEINFSNRSHGACIEIKTQRASINTILSIDRSDSDSTDETRTLTLSIETDNDSLDHRLSSDSFDNEHERNHSPVPNKTGLLSKYVPTFFNRHPHPTKQSTDDYLTKGLYHTPKK